LCYLEGLTNEQAAEHLGCPKGTVLSRLSRAREQLRRRLSRRGVDLTACLPIPLAVAPANLVHSVLRGATVRDAAFSTSVVSLAEGVLLGMGMQKVRVAALVLFTLVALAGAGAWAGRSAAGGSTSRAEAKAAAETLRVAEEKEPAAPAPVAETPTKLEQNKPLVVSRELDLRDALRKTVDWQGIDDPKTTLGEALDQLSKIFSISFDFDEKAFQAEMTTDVAKTEIANPNPLPGVKSTLATVLKRILSRVPTNSGAGYLIRKDHIEITTLDAIRRELGLRKRDANPKDTEEAARPALSPLVWEEFKEVPLQKALREIADDTGVNIVLDPRVEKKGNIDLTTTLRNVPVETAVEVLADMAGLSVVYRDNIVYVTTTENAERLLKSKRWSAEPQRLARKPPSPSVGAM
jgi:hypothetical protein